MKKIILTAPLFSALALSAQKKDKGNNVFSGGVISVGARNTLSLFNGQDSQTGFGMGGQFRIQFGNRLNTDWFMDYITAPVGNYANRSDNHIGWSVMYYFTAPKDPQQFLKPYLLVGHCFDYTKITDNRDKNNFGERWSSAVQGGLGTHFNLTKRFDVSLTGQYMIHLGNQITATNVNEQVKFVNEKGSSLEGHLLMTVSMNYKIADLW